jgi:hypothetical protein
VFDRILENIAHEFSLPTSLLYGAIKAQVLLTAVFVDEMSESFAG